MFIDLISIRFKDICRISFSLLNDRLAYCKFDPVDENRSRGFRKIDRFIVDFVSPDIVITRSFERTVGSRTFSLTYVTEREKNYSIIKDSVCL